MKIRISDLLDGYVDNSVDLAPADWVSADEIQKRTLQKLRGESKRRRPLTMVLLAAALVVLLCGASAIIHYVTLGKSEGIDLTHTMTVRTPEGEQVEEDVSFYAAPGTNTVRIDAAEAGDAPTWVGIRAGWVPDGTGEPFATTLKSRLEYDADPGLETTAMTDEELDSIYLYLGSKVTSEYWLPGTLGNHYYAIYVYSSVTVEDTEFLVSSGGAEIIKEGSIGQFQATWLSIRLDASGTEAADYGEMHYLILFDEATSSLICIAGGLDFPVYEKIAENLELVVTDIPASKPELSFQFMGALG